MLSIRFPAVACAAIDMASACVGGVPDVYGGPDTPPYGGGPPPQAKVYFELVQDGLYGTNNKFMMQAQSAGGNWQGISEITGGVNAGPPMKLTCQTFTLSPGTYRVRAHFQINNQQAWHDSDYRNFTVSASGVVTSGGSTPCTP